jgi:hypothetical protein
MFKILKDEKEQSLTTNDVFNKPGTGCRQSHIKFIQDKSSTGQRRVLS